MAQPKSLTFVAGASGCGLLVWSLSNSTPLTTLTPGIPERIASTASGDTSCSRAIDQSKLSKNSTFCLFRLFVQTQKFQETTPNVMFVPSHSLGGQHRDLLQGVRGYVTAAAKDNSVKISLSCRGRSWSFHIGITESDYAWKSLAAARAAEIGIAQNAIVDRNP
jgi:hypothetical protein